MKIRERLIALFTAVVFVLGVIYAPENAFAQTQDEVQDEEIQLTPIKGEKQDDLLEPIGGFSQVENDLVQEASGEQVAQALAEDGSSLPAAYTSNIGKAKMRDQGRTSLCWAFSAATIAELSRGQASGTYTTFSPAHFGYFFYNRANDPLGNTAGDRNSIALGNTNYATLGGSIVYGFQALANWTGMAGETAYPYSSYVSGGNARAIGSAFAYDNDVIIKSAEMLYDQTEIKQAVIDNGGVEIGYCSGSSSGEYREVTREDEYNGIVTHFRTSGDANHAVTIIGWDDNIPRECFADASGTGETPECNGGWIIQNSWGESDARYFYLSYEEPIVSPYTMDFQPADTYDYNFQYDGSAVNTKRNLTSRDKAANIFTVPSSRGRQSLEAVGFTTWDNSKDRDNEVFTVKIYKNLKSKSNPESGTLAGTYEFTAPNAGYHTFSLGEKILLDAGSTFSVVVIPHQSSWLGVERAASGSWISFSCGFAGNQSMYWASGNGAWYDTYDFSRKECFRIKAFTNCVDNIDFWANQSASSLSYSGKLQAPKVTATRLNLVPLSEGSDYTVEYPSNSKNVGTYRITVNGTGDYSGQRTLQFRIIPKKTTLTKLTRGSRKITVKWSKQTTQVTGYQISYGTKSSFSNAKTVTIKKNSTTGKTIKKLKKRTRYYVRVRTYKTVNGTRYYSSWSNVKSIKTK